MARTLQRRVVDPAQPARVPGVPVRQRPRRAVRAGDGRAGLPAGRAAGPPAARGPARRPDAVRPAAPPVSRRVLVVGAGVGGLAAALRLAQAGLSVRVLEARAEPGGLASQVEAHGLRFDGGPMSCSTALVSTGPSPRWASTCRRACPS